MQKQKIGILTTALGLAALALTVWLGAATPARADGDQPALAAALSAPAVAPAADTPAVSPALNPAPRFMTNYLCTCEVYDSCTNTFILGGRLCPVGDTCTCHAQTGRDGCVSGIASIDCNDNSS